MNDRADIKISGSGTVTGGIYNSISISGSGTVTGDIDAKSIRVSGSGTFEGNVKAIEMKTSGSSHISGDSEIGDVNCSGSCRLDGSLNAGGISSSGTMRIKGVSKADNISASGSFVSIGGIKSGNLKVSGSIEVGADVDVTHDFISTGRVIVDGTLHAFTVKITPGGDCRIGKITGSSITVKVSDRSIGMSIIKALAGGRLGHLKVELIEGEEVEIEDTDASLVRGKRVKIGRGCRVERVEYLESIDIAVDGNVMSLYGPAEQK